MKKFLSLVLALIMVMSLVTVSAGADFTDASKITYDEAVEVMTALKVVDGDTDGSFRPTDTLTRGAAAKIICNLILGPTTAAALKADSAPYPDVAANSTFAGYIAYCKQQGIISGYADGTFKPANTLTGYAFMKMLLGALGYDAEVEGYNVPNWSIAVAKRALNIGLDDGLVDTLDGTAAVTREEALLFAFNAMQATMVEYDTTIKIGDVTVAGSKASEIEYTGKFDGNIKNDDLLQFAEKYFTKLTGKADVDAFDRPATTWKNGTKKIGTYVATADLEYTAQVKGGTIYSDLGLSKNTTTTEYYIDGVKQTNVAINKGDTTNTKIGGNGVLTQVWYDEEAGSLIVTCISTFVGEVASVTKATATADRYITVSKATGLAPNALNSKFETEEFAKGDLVTYTAAQKADKSGFDIQSVAALELTATGILTEWNGTSANVANDDKAGAENNFTVGGETYKYSKYAYVCTDDGFGSDTDISAFDVDESELNVYVDAYGYAIYVDGVEGETNYAALIGLGQSNQYGSETRGATLLFADGTKKEVVAKKASSVTNWTDFTNTGAELYQNLVTDGLGDIVTYTVDEDGVYTLAMASKYDTAYADAANEIIFVNGRSVFKLDDAQNGTGKDKTLYATSETVFMVVTEKVPGNVAKGLNYNVYVGYENMPSIDATVASKGIAYVCDDTYTSQLNVVYLYTPALAGIEDVDTYIVKKADADIITNSKGDYYVLPAIVEGAEATVMISADFVAGSNVFVDEDGYATDSFEAAVGLYALNNVTKNSKDIITNFTVVNDTVFNAENGDEGTVAANKVVLGLDGTKTTATFWAYNDKTSVYVVDKDYKTITVSSVADVDTDANDLVYASHDDDPAQKKLVDVIIVKQDDVAPSTDATIKSLKVKGLDVVDGKVTLTNVAAASNAEVLTVVTNNANATYAVEYKVGSGAWTTFPLTWCDDTDDLSGNADWIGGEMNLRITVTAQDGSTAVYTVEVDYENVYTVTFDVAENVRVTFNGQRVVDGDEWTCGKDYVATIKVVAADGYVAVVEVDGSEVVSYGGEYEFVVSANTLVEAYAETVLEDAIGGLLPW